MSIIKKIGAILCCVALALGNFNVAYASASVDISVVDDIADISDCEAGTYQIVEENLEGKLVTTYVLGESYVVEEESDVVSAKTFSLAASASLYGRTLKQENEYYNVNDVLIYKTTNEASFYWDNTNVWVDSCSLSSYCHSSYTKNVTLTSADTSHSARLYAWSRYHITFTSSTRTFNTVNDVGCSHYGDSKYIKE